MTLDEKALMLIREMTRLHEAAHLCRARGERWKALKRNSTQTPARGPELAQNKSIRPCHWQKWI